MVAGRPPTVRWCRGIGCVQTRGPVGSLGLVRLGEREKKQGGLVEAAGAHHHATGHDVPAQGAFQEDFDGAHTVIPLRRTVWLK